jgi:hypothetical protein
LILRRIQRLEWIGRIRISPSERLRRTIQTSQEATSWIDNCRRGPLPSLIREARYIMNNKESENFVKSISYSFDYYLIIRRTRSPKSYQLVDKKHTYKFHVQLPIHVVPQREESSSVGIWRGVS